MVRSVLNYLKREAARVQSPRKVKKEISLEPMRRITLKVGFFLCLGIVFRRDRQDVRLSIWVDWQDDASATLRLDLASLGANLGLEPYRINQNQNKTPSESSFYSGWTGRIRPERSETDILAF